VAERTDVMERIMMLLIEQLHQEIPNKTTDLIDEGLLDSMLFVDLIMSLEREFGIEIAISDLEIDSFRTVARMAEFVTSRRNSTEPNAVDFGDTADAKESVVMQ